MTVRTALAVLLQAVTLAACSSAHHGRAGPPEGAATTVATTVATPASTSPAAPRSPAASGSWTTYFHDAARSGMASDGPATPASVRRLWTSPTLDGDLYAQPLVVANQVIVATENDTVYALDVATGGQRWRAHLGSPVDSAALPCGDVAPQVGITSTPVVDPETKRVYAVGFIGPGRDVLYALDLVSGAVVASVGVDAPGADPATHNQRAALTLDHGSVLVPFGGRFGDCGTYHGRITSVPITETGLGTPTYYELPTANEGGFWAPTGAVVAGDGSLYITSGNSASESTFDYGNSVVHLSPALSLLDYFAPADWAQRNGSDGDLGSTNPVLVGGDVFQVGKGGVGYLLSANNLGHVGGQDSTAPICPERAMGGVSHNATTMFVPCEASVAAISVAGNHLAVAWRTSVDTPGPAALTPAAVWAVATAGANLVALDPSTGRRLWSESIGSVPSRFTSPAVGSGRVVVAAGAKVLAFGNA